jgi:hypothetical protein
MEYLATRWLHEQTDYPVLLYSELADDRYEARTVEIFLDGRVGLAGPDFEHGDTFLGDAPIPTVEEINGLGEFQARVIDRVEFEAIWDLALCAAGLDP